MSRLSESDLAQFRHNIHRGKHPLKAIDKILKKGAGVAFKSKWESAYANKLELEKRAGIIRDFRYEPFSMWLPGKVRYKPDFMVWKEAHCDPLSGSGGHDEIEIIEVKGWSKNRRDGITRLKMAAALFPCFVWRMVYMKKGGGFDGEYI